MIRLLLLDEMSQHAIVTLVPDPRSIKVESGNSLHDYLQTELWFTKNSEATLFTKPEDSQRCLGIQYADWLAGVVQSHFENRKSDPYSRLAGKLRSHTLFFNLATIGALPSARTKEYQHEQTTHDRLVYRDEEETAKAWTGRTMEGRGAGAAVGVAEGRSGEALTGRSRRGIELPFSPSLRAVVGWRYRGECPRIFLPTLRCPPRRVHGASLAGADSRMPGRTAALAVRGNRSPNVSSTSP